MRTTPGSSAGEPREPFQIPDEIIIARNYPYDVAPDGQRLLMVRKDPAELRPIELVAVPN